MNLLCLLFVWLFCPFWFYQENTSWFRALLCAQTKYVPGPVSKQNCKWADFGMLMPCAIVFPIAKTPSSRDGNVPTVPHVKPGAPSDETFSTRQLDLNIHRCRLPFSYQSSSGVAKLASYHYPSEQRAFNRNVVTASLREICCCPYRRLESSAEQTANSKMNSSFDWWSFLLLVCGYTKRNRS